MKQRLLIFLFFLTNLLSAQLVVNSNVTDSLMANNLAGNGISISNITMNCSNYAYGTFDGTNSNIGINAGAVLTTGFAESPPVTACTFMLELQDANFNGWDCGEINVYINGQLKGSYSENSTSGFTSINLIVETGDNLVIEYVSPGGAGCDENEHSFALNDANYSPLASQNGTITPGVLYTGTVNCSGNTIFENYGAAGPNNENMASFGHGLTYEDPDLTQLVADAINDVCIMEFDLVPSCSLLEINYVFASEEYPDFVCSDMNDIFGFFISGPGISGPFSNGGENIALVPGTNEYVGINTINGGSPGNSANGGTCSSNGQSLANTALFNITGNGLSDCPGSAFCSDNTAIRYNGYTDPLTASANVIPCETYHMKIIIADAGDSGYDSGVFLTYQGLNCPNTDIVANETEAQIVEGCQDGEFEIIKNTNINDDVIVHIYDAGSSTATNILDYTVLDSLMIPGGTSSALINVAGITDGITETTETVDLLIEWLVCNTPYYDTLHFTIVDGPYLDFNVIDENCNTCDGSATVNMVGGSPSYNYSWGAGTGSQTTSTASNLCSGTYFIQVNDGNGCLASDSVTINSSGSAVVSTDITICDGDSILIDGTYQTTAGVYYDTLSTVLNCDSIIATTLTISPNYLIVIDDTICGGDSLFLSGMYQYNTGYYYDTLNTTLGCDSIIETRLVVNPSDNVTILPEAPFCSSDAPKNLSSTTPGGAWSGTGITDPNIGTFSPSISGAGIWLISYNINSTCGGQDTVIITVTEQQDATFTPIGSICLESSPVNLVANNSGGTWSGNGITDVVNGEFNPSITGSGSHPITYSLNGLCGDTATYNLVVNDTLGVNALDNSTICPNSTISLSASAFGGDGNYTYNWSHGLGNLQNIDLAPSNTTTYSVSVTDNCGSTPAIDDVTITVQPIPSIDFNANVYEGCSPLIVEFEALNSPSNVTSYLWDFGNSSNGIGATANTTYQNSGCHPVSLSISTADGCTSSITKPNYICIHPNPEADFVYSPEEITTLNPKATFTNISSGTINSFSWDFSPFASPSNSINSDVDVEFTEPNGGEYVICLSVESNYGCKDEECKVVVVKHEPTLYVPNSFTPNNDHLNDVFKPYVVGLNTGEYRLYIFDRWGNKLFETNDTETGWNGTYNSTLIPSGVYVWKIVITGTSTDANEVHTGHVNLLR